jgi:hypothetical protein
LKILHTTNAGLRPLCVDSTKKPNLSSFVIFLLLASSTILPLSLTIPNFSPFWNIAIQYSLNSQILSILVRVLIGNHSSIPWICKEVDFCEISGFKDSKSSAST